MLLTQYARNGPLIQESRDFVRLVAAGYSRPERRRRLVVDNALGRRSFKSRRNLFEALEMRFSEQSHARDLGVLSYSSANPRALSVGFLTELAGHDELVASYLQFVYSRIGEERRFIDARFFIAELATSSTAAATWAPSLQRRAVASLNSLPAQFGLWESPAPEIVQRPHLPLETLGLLFLWQLERNESVLSVPFLKIIAMPKGDILESLWACARRGWFEIEASGDIVRARAESGDVGVLLGVDRALVAADRS